MKHGIELNGVANILMLLDGLLQEAPSLTNQQYEYVEKAFEQLELLERYMLAQQIAKDSGTTPPFWHEVRENPKLYPTNRERTGNKTCT